MTCCPDTARDPNATAQYGSPTLSYTEARWHFANWAIVSSPLVLSMDLRDTQATNSIWDIISNEEIISINQAG